MQGPSARHPVMLPKLVDFHNQCLLYHYYYPFLLLLPAFPTFQNQTPALPDLRSLPTVVLALAQRPNAAWLASGVAG